MDPVSQMKCRSPGRGGRTTRRPLLASLIGLTGFTLAGLATQAGAAPGDPVARGDTYATPVGKTLTVEVSRVSGVLYNDFDTDEDGNNIGHEGLTAVLVSGPTAGTLNVSPGEEFNGSFVYTPGGSLADNDNDSFTYKVRDEEYNFSEVATVNLQILSDQPDFKIMMNYELGMHCTGFEFSYCCVLPPYNSILAQVVKPQNTAIPEDERATNADFPRLLEGDPNHGLDGLGRETVLRDYDRDGDIQKYYVEYYHDAQPRREGNMPETFNDQTSTLISDVEGNSLLYHNTPYDSALVDANGKLVTGNYDGMTDPVLSGVVQGDGDYTDATDNYANGWLNHFYIYQDLEGTIPIDPDTGQPTSREEDKIRLGVSGDIEYPKNVGAALQPMGPVGNVSGFDNVLTFSGDTGTVVYTQMKVLENLPVMLTSPRIWEALGLPLTPFEDSIDFFGDPGLVDEDSVRPYVAMKARLRHAYCSEGNKKCNKGQIVLGSNGHPVIGFGTAPIDIPNCERCHSVPAYQRDEDGNVIAPNVNSPSYVRRQVNELPGEEDPDDVFSYPYAGDYFGWSLEAITDLEINYWKSVYPNLATGSDWYARLKGAAVNMLAMHDHDRGTRFLANYPTSGNGEPLVDVLGMPAPKQIAQNTRMGHESVICQKCHADNVIAVVKSAVNVTEDEILPPITAAIHRTHRNKGDRDAGGEGGVITFNDGLGRDGGCQGCHPAHRSDGTMDEYPIDQHGNNFQANSDNRLAPGGCFVGRDVHSNPLKDSDGAETDEHLNPVGQWLAENVFHNQGPENDETRGIWCTNCHNQLAQAIWSAEDCHDLINGTDPSTEDGKCVNNVRALTSFEAIAGAVGMTLGEAIDNLDPQVPGYDRTRDATHDIWRRSIQDANVATIEVAFDADDCDPLIPVDFTATYGVYVCVSADVDGDPSVNVLSFCTTQDCVDRINNNKTDQSQWRYQDGNPFVSTNTFGAAVPFREATDGRDHWLAAGEPHCADCHAAPYVEQSGNINAFPPFNYPAKASLMRYSRGHQDLGCQACHESIHGLYPVSAAIDTTSYAQAAALNHDGSHGPLKCGTCHAVNDAGVPTWIRPPRNGRGGKVYDEIVSNNPSDPFDGAVTWAHTYTDEADVRDSTCQNCHNDYRDEIAADEFQYARHAMVGRTSRLMMDKAEVAQLGHVLGAMTNADGEPNPDADTELNELCTVCHAVQKDGNKPNYLNKVKNCGLPWMKHLTQGRVAQLVWEDISEKQAGKLCGW